MRYFTYYWNREQFLRSRDEFDKEGVTYQTDYTGGSGFTERKVAPGDVLYLLNWHEGELSLLGRMTVDRIVGRAEAAAELGDVYDAAEHVLAKPGTATFEVFDAVISGENTEDLDAIGFLTSDGTIATPKRNADGAVEPQTFRNVREVTEDTAALFDYYLGFGPNFEVVDGESIVRLVTFDFLVRDDSGEEVLVSADVPCSSDTLLRRWVDDDVSVTDSGLLTDAARLAPLLWERVQRWCEERDATPELTVDGFSAGVLDELTATASDE